MRQYKNSIETYTQGAGILVVDTDGCNSVILIGGGGWLGVSVQNNAFILLPGQRLNVRGRENEVLSGNITLYFSSPFGVPGEVTVIKKKFVS